MSTSVCQMHKHMVISLAKHIKPEFFRRKLRLLLYKTKFFYKTLPDRWTVPSVCVFHLTVLPGRLSSRKFDYETAFWIINFFLHSIYTCDTSAAVAKSQQHYNGLSKVPRSVSHPANLRRLTAKETRPVSLAYFPIRTDHIGPDKVPWSVFQISDQKAKGRALHYPIWVGSSQLPRSQTVQFHETHSKSEVSLTGWVLTLKIFPNNYHPRFLTYRVIAHIVLCIACKQLTMKKSKMNEQMS